MRKGDAEFFDELLCRTFRQFIAQLNETYAAQDVRLAYFMDRQPAAILAPVDRPNGQNGRVTSEFYEADGRGHRIDLDARIQLKAGPCEAAAKVSTNPVPAGWQNQRQFGGVFKRYRIVKAEQR
jgi:hypothetical protein